MNELINILIILNECNVNPKSKEMQIALGKNELPSTFKETIDKIERELSW